MVSHAILWHDYLFHEEADHPGPWPAFSGSSSALRDRDLSIVWASPEPPTYGPRCPIPISTPGGPLKRGNQKRISVKKLLISLISLLSINMALFAQATTQVSGLVTDPTGAVIPNASLELQNVETGLKRTATSDAGGAYSFVQVIPGQYRISATATGFRTTTINDVRLLVANPATVNVKLEIGQVSESVSVTAEAVQINTTDASIGNAIGTKPIMQMPLNARNIVGLLALQPGVVFTNDDDTDSRNGAVNGGKSDQANVTLDGVDVNDQMDRYAFTSVLRMTPDSVQEFRVTTMNANADSGRSSGAQVQLVTKSGTNDLHGALYEYHRNTVTTANNFFNNSFQRRAAEADPEHLRRVDRRPHQEEPALFLRQLRRPARRQGCQRVPRCPLDEHAPGHSAVQAQGRLDRNGDAG